MKKRETVVKKTYPRHFLMISNKKGAQLSAFSSSIFCSYFTSTSAPTVLACLSLSYIA